METFNVTVKFALNSTGNAGDTTNNTLIVKRKAKDSGEAIAFVSSLFNQLSNVVYENGIPNIAVLKCYTNDI